MVAAPIRQTIAAFRCSRDCSTTSRSTGSESSAMRIRAGGLLLGAAIVLGATMDSQAYFLDSAKRFDVRLRAYSQLSIFTESSSTEGCPGPLCPSKYSAGDLAQHRNFYNPEFDAKLTDYTEWSQNVSGLSLIAPDDFKFRFAWRGFYHGVYDYLDPQWDDHRRNLKARFAQTDDPWGESFTFNDQNK